jgi:hypothetical protein
MPDITWRAELAVAPAGGDALTGGGLADLGRLAHTGPGQLEEGGDEG